MLIIGIDPGLQRTGYGLIRQQGNALSFIACGTIKSDAKDDLAQRVAALHYQLNDVLQKHKPAHAAIEETFVNSSGQSTLKLGQARGALLLTLALANLPVHEYAPTLIKKTVVGNGRAEKQQVAHMVQLLLPGCGTHGADAMDALAIAICHAQHAGLAHLTRQ